MPWTRRETLERRYELARRLGRRLAEARIAAGLSQREAAARLGVAQSALGKLELGRRILTFTEGLDLARLYQVGPDDLDPRNHDLPTGA